MSARTRSWRWAIRRQAGKLPWGYWAGLGGPGGHKGALGKPGCVPETVRQRVKRIAHNATRL